MCACRRSAHPSIGVDAKGKARTRAQQRAVGTNKTALFDIVNPVTANGSCASRDCARSCPDEIKAIIRRVVGAIGKFEHASLQINFGALDAREAQKSMRLFAAEVMPAFTEAAPSTRQAAPLARAR